MHLMLTSPFALGRSEVLLQVLLILPWTRTVGFGPQSFPFAGPLTWNSLPPEMKMISLTLSHLADN